MNGDLRALREKGRWRTAGQHPGEAGAIELRGVPFPRRPPGLGEAPAGMLDPVYRGAALPERRVAPVVLGDEFLQASFRDRPEGSLRFELDRHLPPAEAPRVSDGGRIVRGPAMAHRESDVVLAVQRSGDP